MLLACLLCLTSRAAVSAQTEKEVPPASAHAPGPPGTQRPEAYRLRIANSLYGAVEISTDKGQTWTLVARVQKAATSPSDGGSTGLPSVERANANGVAFSVGGRRLVRILPDLSASYKNPSAIVVSQGAGAGLFRELLPPVGSTVEQIINKREAALPADYLPHDGDVLLVTCPTTGASAERLADQIKYLGERYQQSVAARLRTAGKRPTTGILSITVNLPAGERANALTYFLDGEVLAIQNQAPFVLKLDTRRWPNGEHVLEARALDANGAVLTQKKTLLFVENM